MAGPSAAATRSCSPERGLTRRPCRGLLEAALEHVAAFHEIRRRRDSPSRAPIQSTSATRTATAATTRRYALAYQLPKRNAGRAPCEAATGLPGPRIDVTNWPAQRRSHSDLDDQRARPRPRHGALDAKLEPLPGGDLIGAQLARQRPGLGSIFCLARRRSLSCAIELMRGSARLTTPPSGKSSTGSASARIEELIAAYRRGATAAALAVQFQIHRTTVAALLQRQKIGSKSSG